MRVYTCIRMIFRDCKCYLKKFILSVDFNDIVFSSSVHEFHEFFLDYRPFIYFVPYA